MQESYKGQEIVERPKEARHVEDIKVQLFLNNCVRLLAGGCELGGFPVYVTFYLDP